MAMSATKPTRTCIFCASMASFSAKDSEALCHFKTCVLLTGVMTRRWAQAQKRRNTMSGSEKCPASMRRRLSADFLNSWVNSSLLLKLRRLGDKKGDTTEQAAAKTTASATQPQIEPSHNKRHAFASSGIHRAIRESTVISASSESLVRQLSSASSVMAELIAAACGGSGSCISSAAGDVATSPKRSVASASSSTACRRPSLMPLACSNNFARGVLRTSGSSSLGMCSSKNSPGTIRTHQPGLVLPARPSRCLRAEWEHHWLLRVVMPGWEGSLTVVR
mmetsp:Transcript_41260/g.108801  ORF Transcript_41260/g.108801 Transcript_41260/m.108801 type:complete len:278 (+) Transcript_41260:1627-2460(+)